MAIVNAYLAWEASTTTGTGTYALNGIPFDSDRTTFANVINSGDQVVYIAVATGAASTFEVNIGTWTAAGNTLTRDVLLFSTTGVAINWGVGTRQVRAIQEPVSTAGFLLAANNLSDVANPDTARTNLGLGTMSTETATNYVDKRVNDQTILGTTLRLQGGGPNRFVAEESGGPGAWYGWRTIPNRGVIAHDDGVTDADIVTFDHDNLVFLSGLKISGLDGAVAYLRDTLAANQTTNLVGGNHIQFKATPDDTSGDIIVSGGTGQQLGLFSCPPGIWLVQLHVRILGASATQGQLFATLRNVTTGLDISERVSDQAPNFATAGSILASTTGLLDNISTNVIEARIINSVNVDAILTDTTQITFFGVLR